MTPEQAFGRVLRALRQERGFSQEALALDSGYDRTYIGLLEQGRRSPSLGAIYRLARALAVAPSDVLRRVEAHAPEITARSAEEK